jgi:hypothetical protein
LCGFATNLLRLLIPFLSISKIFPTAQTQCFAGKKVSLRRRQQADTPNHCSTWHKSIKILLWYASNCNALRAAIAGLSYCLQFLRLRSGSYCVLHATLIITSFVPLHYTSFVAKPFALCWASQA